MFHIESSVLITKKRKWKTKDGSVKQKHCILYFPGWKHGAQMLKKKKMKSCPLQTKRELGTRRDAAAINHYCWFPDVPA